MRLIHPAIGLLLALFVPMTATAQPASPLTKSAQSVNADKVAIYDESADAKAVIAAAVSKAKRENRRVLIQWGANWCGWCRLLHGTMNTDAVVKKELLYEYDVVLINVGKFDKNLDLAAGYKADIKSGIPYLTVLDAEGKPIANQETGALEDKTPGVQRHDVAKVMEFLKKNEAPRVRAADVLTAGLAEAAASHKRVFLHFGAPWCGWCHKLEGWMDRPEVATVFAKDFVNVKIDQDRMPGAEAIFSKYNTSKGGGIPWFAVLDEKGVAMADSNRNGKNIGFPAAPEEVSYFESMLKKTKRTMSDAELFTLIDNLRNASPKH